VQDPSTCDVRSYTVDGSAAFETASGFVAKRLADGLVVHRQPELDLQTIESVVLGVDGKSAVVTFCEVDGYWLYDASGTWADLSDDVLIDDSLNSFRLATTIKLTPTGWRMSDNDRLNEWPGENQCG
jgi:hypothetical protein